MTAMAVAEVASDGIQNVTGDLTPGETRHLQMLEKRIERGLNTFREVGNALLEIRDKRLFRMTHPTFEAYVGQRWQLARARAYQLMGAAEVAAVLGPDYNEMLVNEAQARELVPVLHTDPKLVPKVLDAVRASGEVTAPAIRKAAQTVAGLHVDDTPPPSPTDRLVSRLGGISTEYVEWQKTRPKRPEKTRVKEAFDRLCAIVERSP